MHRDMHVAVLTSHHDLIGHLTVPLLGGKIGPLWSGSVSRVADDFPLNFLDGKPVTSASGDAGAGTRLQNMPCTSLRVPASFRCD